MDNSYLQHYGVKGMKWGVRRYQNADGTLTAAGKKRKVKQNAKEINREIKKSIKQTGETTTAVSDAVKQASKVVDKNITKEQLKKFKDANEKFAKIEDELDSELEKLKPQRQKIAKQLYNEELKRNPSLYPSDRDKAKLYEYCYFDDSYDVVRKNNQQINKLQKEADNAWAERQDVCKQITNDIIGSYGNKRYYTLMGNFTTEEFTRMAVSSLSYSRYKN